MNAYSTYHTHSQTHIHTHIHIHTRTHIHRHRHTHTRLYPHAHTTRTHMHTKHSKQLQTICICRFPHCCCPLSVLRSCRFDQRVPFEAQRPLEVMETPLLCAGGSAVDLFQGRNGCKTERTETTFNLAVLCTYIWSAVSCDVGSSQEYNPNRRLCGVRKLQKSNRGTGVNPPTRCVWMHMLYVYVCV